MDVAISPDTSMKVQNVSEMLGISQQEVVDRAILVYLDSLEKFLDFKKELAVWDKLSDEAWEIFEKSL